MTAESRPISEEDLHGFVDGGLDADRRAAVEAYLRDAPAAAARVRGWQAGRASLLALQAASAMPAVPARLDVQRLAAARRARQWTPARVAAGLLLALSLGAAGGWFAHQPPSGSGLSALGAEAIDAHRVFAAGAAPAIEVAASDLPGQIASLGGFIGHRVVVPDLSAAGYRLLGARLIATPHGGGCLFLYDGGALGPVSILMRTMHDVAADAPMRAVGAPGMPGYAWSRRGLGISLVAAGTADQVHQLSDHVRDELAAGI